MLYDDTSTTQKPTMVTQFTVHERKCSHAHVMNKMKVQLEIRKHVASRVKWPSPTAPLRWAPTEDAHHALCEEPQREPSGCPSHAHLKFRFFCRMVVFFAAGLPCRRRVNASLI